MKFVRVAFVALTFLALAVTGGGAQSVERISLGGPVSPDGTEVVSVDLPPDQRISNIGSHRDGAGMCVMTSIEMMFRWHGLEEFRGLRDWCARQPGGAYPEKVDRQLQEFVRERGLRLPPYFQYEGSDLSVLREALAGGRMVSVTYSGRDGVRYRSPIAHMVNLVHLSDRWACVLDNNAVGENELIWMTPQEFRERWVGGRNGWAVFCTACPPPPPPRNASGPRPLPPAVTVTRTAEALSWAQHPNDRDCVLLYQGNRCVGAYYRSSGLYYPWDSQTSRFGRPSLPPIPVEGATTNYGVVASGIARGERFSYQGQVVTSPFRGPGRSVPADSDQAFLTVIGTQEDVRRVRDHLERHPSLAPWRGRLRVNFYAPDHWALRPGFQVSGRPTIYVQAPDGTVLHRQDDYRDGADGLAKALRRADPNYRPERDRDRRQDGFLLDLTRDQVLVGGLVLLVLVLALKRGE